MYRIRQDSKHDIVRHEFMFHVDDIVHLLPELGIMRSDSAQLSSDIDMRQMKRTLEKFRLRALAAPGRTEKDVGVSKWHRLEKSPKNDFRMNTGVYFGKYGMNYLITRS